MLLSRKKKIARDREAGMVFPWRGGGSGNTGGLTLAFFLATLLFALGFVSFSMPTDKGVVTTRRSAEVMLVSGDDPRLIEWVDGSSPFPARWDPDESGEIESRVDRFFDTELKRLSVREFDWREQPKLDEGVDTPSVYQSSELIFPPLPEHEEVKFVASSVGFKVVAEILGEGSKRFPDAVKVYSREIPDGEYGKQWRWLVTLGGDGRVVHCVPVEPLKDDFALSLERWLWVQVFKKGDVGETVNVMVSVVRSEDD